MKNREQYKELMYTSDLFITKDSSITFKNITLNTWEVNDNTINLGGVYALKYKDEVYFGITNCFADRVNSHMSALNSEIDYVNENLLKLFKEGKDIEFHIITITDDRNKQEAIEKYLTITFDSMNKDLGGTADTFKHMAHKTTKNRFVYKPYIRKYTPQQRLLAKFKRNTIIFISPLFDDMVYDDAGVRFIYGDELRTLKDSIKERTGFNSISKVLNRLEYEDKGYEVISIKKTIKGISIRVWKITKV